MQLNTSQGISPFAARPAMDASSAATSGPASDSGSASITANDFLELLVTEMRNQDPTADTDPNEYINQLVQVNSLQQLMQINQDLGGGTSTSSSTSASAAGAVTRAVASPGSATRGGTTGNLSVPGRGAAASRIVSALASSASSPAPSPVSSSRLHLPASNPNPAR